MNPTIGIVLAVLWILSPLDIDMVPFIGTIDDALVACLAYKNWLNAQNAVPKAGGSQIIEATLVERRD
jgi:uncharacterized membrane protein YkvA (DUF1232 family)